MSPTYFLSDVDGVLCVAARSTDWSEPRYTVNHYPTKLRTWDFCRYMECRPEEIRERYKVREDFPGCYVITHDGGKPVWGRAYGLDLTGGGRTLSVSVTHEPVPVPKTRKGDKLEWMDGRWHKCTPKGGWKTISV